MRYLVSNLQWAAAMLSPNAQARLPRVMIVDADCADEVFKRAEERHEGASIQSAESEPLGETPSMDDLDRVREATRNRIAQGVQALLKDAERGYTVVGMRVDDVIQRDGQKEAHVNTVETQDDVGFTIWLDEAGKVDGARVDRVSEKSPVYRASSSQLLDAMHTPWGRADSVTRIPVPGKEGSLMVVSTPSHGGIYVPDSLLAEIPEAHQKYAERFSRSRNWYEEDVACIAVMLAFPACFKDATPAYLADCRGMLDHYVQKHATEPMTVGEGRPMYRADCISSVAIIVDGAQLASAMRKWLNDTASDSERACLLVAGYLKFIPGGRGALGATAKGWQEARNPKRVSEVTRVNYDAEQKPNWCPKCQTHQFPFEPEEKCRTCGTKLIARHATDSKRLDAYGRFARDVQRAVEEEDGYDALKQAIRAATTVLHDKLLKASGIVSERPADIYGASDDALRGSLPTGTEIVAMCPKCNGEHIGEKNVAYALLDVTSWEVDQDGHATPSAYDGDNSAEWMTADEMDLYECRSCGWKGDLAELVYRAKPEEK